jgi:F-type H+-transporting ATPase subunit delta
LGILAAHRRLGLLPAVLSEIRTQADAAQGRARVKVESARPLTPAQRDALGAKVKSSLKVGSVDLDETVAPGLQAGFRAFFGGRVWDASLAGQLRRLKDSLTVKLGQPL